MSKDSSSENEAMIAAKQLHALLAKHNVSMSELEDKEDEVGIINDIYKCRPWKRLIAMYVGKLYFCEFIFTRIGRGKSQYAFVGKEHNRLFASHILSMILSILEKQARRESKAAYGKEVPSFVNSFWTGAAGRIVERCKELIQAAKVGELEDEEGNTLPAMLDIYELSHKLAMEFMDNNFNHKPAACRTKSNDPLGRSKGVEAGNKVQLSRSIQSQQSPKLLGN